MKITYIGHSGFLVETQNVNFIFDYYSGEIPRMPAEKPLYVLVSHKHADHFNPEIFQLEEKYSHIKFLLSYDIKVTPYQLEKWKVSEGVEEKITTIKAHENYELSECALTTLKSTDSGVAFLVFVNGQTIYHGGDLNWWCWEGETKQESHNMTANFKREIERLSNIFIDVAFLPIDPRQEALYYLGMEYFMEHVQTGRVFPMHFWEDFSICDKFLLEGHCKGKETVIQKIHRTGETFTIQ
ncbi:MAG TPA: MBL fold metallo-hydrolase [Lachnospiraceae bacterium]|nr:MBL fold metallo-hydrolase [Lachnospiraceae bacterium]